MHIKQVKIDGFRSYKDETTTEAFDPRLNVIVGANGSGKTNLFHAIRFVVNDVFSALRQEERQQLLHEGNGSLISTATVEVLLDNSDRRFPSDKDEVRIRRSVGMKKDDFFLDKKHITRKELVDLLETAGISRSNPYYVVQQGKIMSMANMRDVERLELLKEIGGAKVYEDRRKESIKIMNETNINRVQIEDMIKNIESKLSELDEEREELVRYQRLDKKRRSIEFTLYNAELRDIAKELEKLEVKEKTVVSKAQGVQTRVESVRSKIKKSEKEFGMLNEMKGQQLAKQKAAIEEKNNRVRDHARLELDVLELQSALANNQTSLLQDQEALEEIEHKIKEHTEQINTLNEMLQSSNSDEKLTLQRKKDEATCRLNLLLQKQGRDAQFSSVEERDRWILNEIMQLQTVLKDKAKVINSLKHNTTQQKKELKKMNQVISELEKQEEMHKESELRQDKERDGLRKERDEMQNGRRLLFKKDADLEESIHSLKEQCELWEKQLEKGMPGGLKRTIDAIKTFVKQQEVDGVYGIVGELIKCREQYFTAVEVAARNHLFSMIVDRSETAERLIQYLTKEKLGRVTFIPLHRIQSSFHPDPAENIGEKAFPLMKVLQISPPLEPALRHIFGKTALVSDLEVASEVSKRGFNCVTLEGDEVRKIGAMKGGYHEKAKSKLKAIKETIRCSAELLVKQEEHQLSCTAFDEIDQRIAECVGLIEKLNLDSRNQRTKLNEIRLEMRNNKQQAQRIKEDLVQIERNMESLLMSKENVEKQIESLRDEEGTALNSKLSRTEKGELKSLQEEIQNLEDGLEKTKSHMEGMETQKSLLKENLEENLKLKRDELEQGIQEKCQVDRKREMEEKKGAVDSMQAEISVAQEEEKRMNLVIEELNRKQRAVKAELEGLYEADAESTTQKEVEDSSLEKLELERCRLNQKTEEVQKRVRDIGSIPEDAFGKYEDHTNRELYTMLKSVKKSLAKLTHVNKKAADQYSNFSNQKEEMILRHSSLINSEENIKQLIRFLDMQKDEAIERTFKEVARNFKQIFAELVAGGTGELIMQKRIMTDDEEDDEEYGSDPIPPRTSLSGIDQYTGVKVKVCFGGGETMSLRQLSGGQKTLVALTLIFAIQRCDPAPFYLFDEIDAALDPLHRTAVAQLLKKQVASEENPVQFILTTFHPQIVQEANKIYGVSYDNKISSVNVIDEEGALEFLQSTTAQR